MNIKISSNKNDLIKDISTIQSKSKERRLRNITMIEGVKEVSIAAKAGVYFDKVLFCPEIILESEVKSIIGIRNAQVQLYELTQEVFSKISYRETTGGIICIAKTKEKILDDLEIGDNSLFIVLESVEKPGNLGAICRIADAAKVSGIIICDPLTDIYNPNTVRASLGCVFSVDIVTSATDNVIKWLRDKNVNIFAAELKASEYYHKINLYGKTALVFGTEATGLTKKWVDNADFRIKIPMSGEIDSLNVSVSVAIMVFEAMRQRDFLV
ncbi:MAG TPA: RNA methyltransferase [Bacteroidales bacterium]|nr:RNA methyltransferase [Bacteroidales bacterium]